MESKTGQETEPQSTLFSKKEKLTKLLAEVLLVGLNVGNRGIYNKKETFPEIGNYINNSLNILSKLPFVTKKFGGEDVIIFKILQDRLDTAINEGESLIESFHYTITYNLEWKYDSIFHNLEETINSLFLQESEPIEPEPKEEWNSEPWC